jgi:hypothetical protein
MYLLLNLKFFYYFALPEPPVELLEELLEDPLLPLVPIIHINPAIIKTAEKKYFTTRLTMSPPFFNR